MGQFNRKSLYTAAAAAVAMVAAAQPALADFVYTGPTGGSWFDGSSWTNTAPEPNTTGTLPDNTQTTNINNGTNGGGVDFDPVAQGGSTSVTIGRLYISSNNSGPGSSDPEFSGQSLQPNILTVNSGTLTTGDQFHVGRHTHGTFNLNGGTFNATDFRVTDVNTSSAQVNLNGGILNVAASMRVAKASGSTSIVRIGHSAGTGNRINIGSDITMTEGGSTQTGHSTLQFVYENGGVQTVEVGDELSLRNGADAAVADRSARFDFVLEEAPTLVNGSTPDLGLLMIGRRTTNVSGGTALFRNADNTSYLDEGSLITASFGGTDYAWLLTYAGNITMDGTTGEIASLSTTGGNDIVLMGQPVPEPVSLALLGLGGLALIRRRRRA